MHSDKSTSSTSKKRKLYSKDTAAAWIQTDAGYTVDLAVHGSPVPSARLEALSIMSDVSVDLGSPDAVPAIFTRSSIAMILGGATQGLIVR